MEAYHSSVPAAWGTHKETARPFKNLTSNKDQ